MKRTLAALVLCLGSLGTISDVPARATPGRNGMPGTILWAWERSEDLRFIDSSRVGVAFLARTVRLSGDDVSVRPRVQPLSLAPGTHLTAVVRIEIGPTRPSLSASQRDRVVDAIVAAGREGVRAMQIDFDATASERTFYRELIVAVRERLPRERALSITALASWCVSDHWLDGLPLDDAVPMLFRMGVERATILAHLRDRRRFDREICRQSLGVSTDEAIARLPPARRLYLFSPESWTSAALETALARLEQ